MKSEVEKIKIVNEADIEYYANRFFNGPEFAIGFEFENDDLYNHFFTTLGIDPKAFQEKYYYFDKERNIHIAESENGYVWVSTMGLIASHRLTHNNYVNACCSQAFVFKKLLDEAITLCEDEKSYDINGYNYSMVQTLTPALLHNMIFYYEVLAKAYLSICGKEVQHIHKIEDLTKLVKETMFEKNHNNTLFHADVIVRFEELSNHITKMAGRFREVNVKYDDNAEDSTVIQFNIRRLVEMKDFVEFSCDIIMDLLYNPQRAAFMEAGLFQRLIEKCKSEEAKKSIQEIYGFLMDKK